MIPFEGRSSLKQYISLKPVKQGFKVWVRVDSLNGYFCEFEVYTGKADTTAEHNLSERVVHKLTRSISGLNHQVFCDRFFTSADLFSSLLQRKVCASGTNLTTCRHFPVDLSGVHLNWETAVPFSANREHRCRSVDGQEDYQCTVYHEWPWHLQPVKRKQKDGSTLMVDCPSSIVTYNNLMGGVNCGDHTTTSGSSQGNSIL